MVKLPPKRDPMDDVISWQLRSHFPGSDFWENRPKKKKEGEMAISGFGTHSKGQLEDKYLDAIQKKMIPETRNEAIFRLYNFEGYNQQEIAVMHGVSQQRVQQILVKRIIILREDLYNDQKNDIILIEGTI